MLWIESCVSMLHLLLKRGANCPCTNTVYSTYVHTLEYIHRVHTTWWIVTCKWKVRSALCVERVRCRYRIDSGKRSTTCIDVR